MRIDGSVSLQIDGNNLDIESGGDVKLEDVDKTDPMMISPTLAVGEPMQSPTHSSPVVKSEPSSTFGITTVLVEDNEAIDKSCAW